MKDYQKAVLNLSDARFLTPTGSVKYVSENLPNNEIGLMVFFIILTIHKLFAALHFKDFDKYPFNSSGKWYYECEELDIGSMYNIVTRVFYACNLHNSHPLFVATFHSQKEELFKMCANPNFLIELGVLRDKWHDERGDQPSAIWFWATTYASINAFVSYYKLNSVLSFSMFEHIGGADYSVFTKTLFTLDEILTPSFMLDNCGELANMTMDEFILLFRKRREFNTLAFPQEYGHGFYNRCLELHNTGTPYYVVYGSDKADHHGLPLPTLFS